MAKLRSVNTHFWDDTYIVGLDPVEKLLFLYLLTNGCTDICGAYEINLRRISLDTGIDREMILKIVDRFSAANKITYQDGWVLVHNFVKNQSSNPSVIEGVIRSLSSCPDWVKHRLLQTGGSLPQAVLLYLTKLNLTLPTEAVEIPDGFEIHFGAVKTQLLKLLNLKKLSREFEWERAVAWGVTNGFTADQFIECFELLQKQEWRDSAVKAQHVVENLPNLAKLKAKTGNGHSNGNGNEKPPTEYLTVEQVIENQKIDLSKLARPPKQ